MQELKDLLFEVTRPERERGDVAVWRRANVTGVDAGTGFVQTDLTGTAWLPRLVSTSPAVGDVVELLCQGTNYLVLGVATA